MFFRNRAIAVLGITLLFGVVALAACGTERAANGNEAEAQDGQFRIGEPVTDSQVAVIVTSEYGTDTLSMADYRQQFDNVSQYWAQAGADPSQLDMVRVNIIEQFVDRHILLGEAAARGIEPDAVELEAQMTQFHDQFPDDETYREWLRGRGMTEEFVRGEFRDQIRVQTLIERMADESPAPTEADVAQYREDQAVEVSARHILIRSPRGADPATDMETRARAQAVLDSVRAGADFEEMAARHSEDPGSAERGGALGFFSRGDMVPEFEQAVFALEEPGDMTPELVRTQFGYHIIQLSDRREGDPVDADAATEMLRRQRQDEFLRTEIRDLRSKATVRVNPSVVDTETLEQHMSE